MNGDPSPAAMPRCPACAAAVRPEAPWCTQCYADLRPAPAPETPAAPAPTPSPLDAPVVWQMPHQALGDDAASVVPVAGSEVGPAADSPTTPSVTSSATWPCTTCGASNPLASTECSACGSGFLAAVRSTEQPLLVIPGLGDLTRYSRAQRLGLATAFVLGVFVLVVVVGLLL